MSPLASTVAELVVARPARARLFERLGLDYCCGGGRPLADACRDRGLDPDTVAALLDALDDGTQSSDVDWGSAPIGELCDHIVDVHHGYLRRELPRIGELLEKCVTAHGAERPELAEAQATFDRLRAELEAQLEEEEWTLFPQLREGVPLRDGLVGELRAEHAETGALLERLSELTDGYDEERAACNTHRATLYALAELERDVHEHVHEENDILFPRVLGA